MVKNRIMFINPPISSDINLKYSSFKLPLGFMYMASLLEKNDFIVKILDCPLFYYKRKIINKSTVKIGSFDKDIASEIKSFNPDIIGIQCAYTAYESDSFDLISLVKKVSKEMGKDFLIVVGGAHTSANPDFVLRNKDIDIAVIGEGEETMLEIAKNYSTGKKIDNIKGTAFIKNKFIKNQSRTFIQNLDDLVPAYHLVDMEAYFKHPDNSRATMRNRVADIITSRGCPAYCVFCSIHTVWGRKWRGRSPKSVVDEIELLIEKYNVRQLRIQDDNLTLDKKRILDICDEIIKRKLDIKWDTPNGIAIWALDEKVIHRMKQAGCYRITFGIESGCHKSQVYVRKVLDFKKIHNFIDFCHKNQVWVCGTFIIGFPYETKDDIEETRKFIMNSKINFPFIYIAQPYLGTDMYEDFKKENLIVDIKDTSNILSSKYNTKFFKSEELNVIRNDLLKEFYKKKIISYLNPFVFYEEFLSKVRSYEDFKYVLKMIYQVIYM